MDQLYGSGMVDEAEREALLEPIETRERLAERRGPVWCPPVIIEVTAVALLPKPGFARSHNKKPHQS